ncbi:MAG: DHA2 family efflux MFS transporter permease subunit [Acidobacteriota bacterium]|nr:MAG: DHA2 family efflux MFS transporter permease subunit [Acidobacteriota bacterium]
MASAAADLLPGGSFRSYRALVAITGMTAAFSMVFSGTIVNVAVPNVMGAFGVGQDKAQFLTTAYVATMVASQLLSAWFITVLGRRAAFLAVLGLFMAGGLLCVFGPNLDLIIFGRIMQGFAAGIIQPLVMVTLFQLFPEHRRGTAMAVYSTGLVLALGLGPVVGGITIDTLGWRYVFYAPLPFVAAAFLLGTVFMPVGKRSTTRPPFDWIGYALLCTSLYSFMSAIANGQREGWASNLIVTLFLVGGLSAALFIRSQLRPGAALLELGLFRNPRFAAAASVAFVFGVGNFSLTYVIPVFAQLVQGYTPTLAGFVLLPASLVVVAMAPFTGWLSDRIPSQFPIVGGLMLFVIGALLLAGTDVNTVFWTMAMFALVGRAGMGFISAPLSATALRAVTSEQLNQASGTLNFCRQLGGALGINTLVAWLEIRTQFHNDALTTTQVADNAATRELIEQTKRVLAEGGIADSAREALALDHLGQMIQAQAETLAFQDGFLLVALVFVLALIPALVLGRSRTRAARA